MATGYYDYVLGLIPAALVGISGVLMAIGAPLVVAVPVGAAVALGLMAHAIFVEGPVDEPDVTVSNAGTAGGPTPAPGNSD